MKLIRPAIGSTRRRENLPDERLLAAPNPGQPQPPCPPNRPGQPPKPPTVPPTGTLPASPNHTRPANSPPAHPGTKKPPGVTGRQKLFSGSTTFRFLSEGLESIFQDGLDYGLSGCLDLVASLDLRTYLVLFGLGS